MRPKHNDIENKYQRNLYEQANAMNVEMNINMTIGSAGADAQLQTTEKESLTEKYLSFYLGDEVYGIGILVIKEIIEYMNVARVPMVPSYIRGVINLRGNVVPVIDLSARLGLPAGEVNRRTSIVIVEVGYESETLDIGIVVDSVNEVLNMPVSDIEPAPAFGANIDVNYINGMGRHHDDFVTLLELQKVLDVEELSDFLQSSAEGSKPN